jgi:hypothetical protein
MNRDPHHASATDLRMLKCIRCADLDALWLLEPRTVNRTLVECKKGLGIAMALGFKNKLFAPMGPYPVEDSFWHGSFYCHLAGVLKSREI